MRSTNSAAVTGKRFGDYAAIGFAERNILTGSGTARIYLVSAEDKSDNPKQISNNLDLKVEFTDRK
jgi:hypothetical protein